MKKVILGLILSLLLTEPSSGAEASRSDLFQQRIGEIEAAVARICSVADRGNLKETARIDLPAMGLEVPAVQLGFHAETLERDLDRAVEQIVRLEQMLLASRKAEAAARDGDGQASSRPLTFEERLRQAEGSIAPATPSRQVPAFDVFASYEATVRDRNAARDAQAESDMGRVAEERRQADALQTARREAEHRVQDQNRQWQDELDNHARTHAEAEARWKQEHSAGAFVRNIVRTVVGGAASSFAGGFSSSIGGGLADKVVRDRFPDFKPSGEYDREGRK